MSIHSCIYSLMLLFCVFVMMHAAALTNVPQGDDAIEASSVESEGRGAAAIEEVDANGVVFLRQYELINEDILTELTECIIDTLQLDTFDSNIIYMVLSTPNHKAELELKEKGYKYTLIPQHYNLTLFISS